MKEWLGGIPNWLVNLISVISGVVTIVTAIVSVIFFCLNPTKFYINGVLITSTFVFGSFCVLLFFRAKKYRNLSSKRITALSFNYHHFLHTSRNVYYEVMKCWKDGKLTVETLSSIYKGKLEHMLDDLCSIMFSMAGRDVSACIKLVSPYDLKDNLDDCTLVTFCRSRNSATARLQYDGSFSVKIKDNTDFYAVLHNENKDNCFYADDLRKIDKKLREVGKKYKNTNPNWEDYYIGTIVVPIRLKSNLLVEAKKYRDEDYDLLGFLCVDSIKADAFTKRQRECNINIMHSFSDAIYVLLGQYMHYMRKLEEKETVKATEKLDSVMR